MKFSSLDEKTGRILKNPFFTDESILPSDSDRTKMDALMKNMGYFKKEALLAELSKTKTETKKPNEGTNLYFNSPSNKKYAVTKETDILVSGNVPEGVTGVYINNYQLKAFSPKEKKFYYRAKTDIGTLKNGANTYTLAFEVGGKRVTKETLTLFLATTPEEAEAKEREYEEKFQSERNNMLAQEQKASEEKKILAEKIEPLDPAYYYDKNLKRYTLNFVYTKQIPYMETLAMEIAKHITEL